MHLVRRIKYSTKFIKILVDFYVFSILKFFQIFVLKEIQETYKQKIEERLKINAQILRQCKVLTLSYMKSLYIFFLTCHYFFSKLSWKISFFSLYLVFVPEKLAMAFCFGFGVVSIRCFSSTNRQVWSKSFRYFSVEEQKSFVCFWQKVEFHWEDIEIRAGVRYEYNIHSIFTALWWYLQLLSAWKYARTKWVFSVCPLFSFFFENF